MPSKTSYILFLNTINDTSIQQLFSTVANDIPKDTETLYIAICTEGGSVSHGIAAYNLLRALPYDIIMHNISNIDSIGNVVLMAGHKRFGTPESMFLIHHVSTTFNHADKIAISDLKEKLSSIEGDEKRINKILKAHTKLTDQDIKDLYKVGQSKDATYALEKDIIQEIKEIKFPKDAKILIIQG